MWPRAAARVVRLRAAAHQLLAGRAGAAEPLTAAARPLLACALVGFSCVLFAGAMARAYEKPLWHDELFTVYLSALPSVGAVWEALATATDLNPPGYYVLVRAAGAVVPSPQLAVRLPAAVAVLAGVLCLFAFISYRYGRLAGLLAMAFPFSTAAASYAYEGRAYGVLIGCAGVALLCWQRATAERRARARGAWLIGLSLALALAVSCHYYGILLWAPLVAGELERFRLRRRVDAAVGGALAIALVPLAFFLPLIRAAREFAPAFWGRPEPLRVAEFYRMLLEPAVVPAAAALLLAGAAVSFGRASHRIRKEAPNGASHEAAAILVLAALPAVLYGVSLLTGAYVNRYALAAVLGVSAVVAILAAAGPRRALVAIALTFTCWAGAKQMAPLRSLEPAPVIPAAFDALPAAGPILVTDARVYLMLFHYAPELRARLVYGVKPAALVAQTRGDTGSRALRLLARYVPLTLVEIDEFVGRHARFAVYGPANWVNDALSGRVALRLLAADERALLLEASAR